MKHVVLLDYGVGNIHSISKALERCGAVVEVRADAAGVLQAPALVLPGVGAFGAVARVIAPYRAELRRRLQEGLPALGICIGMQILYESSEESPGDGIGLLPGQVRRLRHARLPHIGWNLVSHPGSGIFRGVSPGARFYYVHTFAPSECGEGVLATSDHGGRFAAAVRSARTWGVQFHPEKSSEEGLRVIRNFVDSLETTA